MKISKITIKNFRSIKSSTFSCNALNIFVGQNNAGKTNFFEAMEWFFNGPSKSTPLSEIYPNRNSTLEISVEVEFCDAQHGAQNMRNEANRTKILDTLEGSDTITMRRSSQEPNKRTIEVNGRVLEKNPTGFDKALNDFLPKFEYIHTKQYFDEVAKYSSKSPVGVMLSSVLETILEDNQQYRDFKSKFDDLFGDDNSAIRVEFDRLGGSVQAHLAKQFTECTKVSFQVASPEFEDLLKSFQTRVDDGVETFAYEKGDGMQRALMLAIIQAYADYRKGREDAGKSFIFFIDEAELHLHPTAQRKLKNVLLELAQTLDQMFINTHSSVFIADDHDSQLLFKVEKELSTTTILPIDAFDKPYVVFDLLGGSPADLLLPRNFLIVEGPSEFEFLTRVIKRFYKDKPPIQIVSAEGDTHQAKRSINAIKKVFAPLGASLFKDRLVILCDKPTEKAKAGFDEFMVLFKEYADRGQIHILPCGSLEECYPDRNSWKRDEAAVKQMQGYQKLTLARQVGDDIDQGEFETSMSAIFTSLSLAWTNAY